MTEEVVEYKPRGELKFVRLRKLMEDLVGYVTYHEDYIKMEMPLRIEVETYFDEGRQVLALQEYLPQAVVEIKIIEISNEDVMFITPVRQDFIEQYEYVSDFFYNNVSKIKPPPSKQSEKVTEEVSEKMNKVVSILEAMASKKDKPVH